MLGRDPVCWRAEPIDALSTHTLGAWRCGAGCQDIREAAPLQAPAHGCALQAVRPRAPGARRAGLQAPPCITATPAPTGLGVDGCGPGAHPALRVQGCAGGVPRMGPQPRGAHRRRRVGPLCPAVGDDPEPSQEPAVSGLDRFWALPINSTCLHMDIDSYRPVRYWPAMYVDRSMSFISR